MADGCAQEVVNFYGHRNTLSSEREFLVWLIVWRLKGGAGGNLADKVLTVRVPGTESIIARQMSYRQRFDFCFAPGQ